MGKKVPGSPSVKAVVDVVALAAVVIATVVTKTPQLHTKICAWQVFLVIPTKFAALAH